MGFAFHWIPARNGQEAAEVLNASLRVLRVLAVERHFCVGAGGGDSGWAVCVEYAEAGAGGSRAGGNVPGGGKRIDYREVLDPVTFGIFSALRQVRRELAVEEAVPVYAIMTNEQLAEIARRRCATLSELEAVDGVGPARVRSHGQRFLETIREAIAKPPPPAQIHAVPKGETE